MGPVGSGMGTGECGTGLGGSDDGGYGLVPGGVARAGAGGG